MEINSREFRTAIKEIASRRRYLIRSAKKEARASLERLYTKAGLIYPPKRYSVGEEIFNSISHGVGAILALVCTIILVVVAYRHCAKNKSLYIVSYSVFGLCLLVLYLMSTLYHALTPLGAKIVFGIMDHCSIYLLIAGTYTPYCLTVLRGTVGYMLLLAIWTVALIGMILYALFRQKVKVLSCILYVLMGYAIVLAWKPLSVSLGPKPLSLLALGGGAYTIGIVFYALKSLAYAHSIWHLFTILGSTLHFFSLYYYIKL